MKTSKPQMISTEAGIAPAGGRQMSEQRVEQKNKTEHRPRQPVAARVERDEWVEPKPVPKIQIDAKNRKPRKERVLVALDLKPNLTLKLKQVGDRKVERVEEVDGKIRVVFAPHQHDKKQLEMVVVSNRKFEAV